MASTFDIMELKLADSDALERSNVDILSDLLDVAWNKDHDDLSSKVDDVISAYVRPAQDDEENKDDLSLDDLRKEYLALTRELQLERERSRLLVKRIVQIESTE